MAAPIVEDIRQRVTGLRGGADETRVIAVREYRAAALRDALAGEDLVDAPGRGDLERLDPAREGTIVIRFDDQVQVITLEAEVHRVRQARRRVARSQPRLSTRSPATAGVLHGTGRLNEPIGDQRSRS